MTVLRGPQFPAGPAGEDWFAQQGVPPAQAQAPPIQNGMASAQQSLVQLQNSPGYQFRLGEGLKALERSAAARGTLLTGGTLKGLTRFGQDYASNEYQNRANQLSGLANYGSQASALQAGANTQFGQQAGNLITNQGNATAAGGVGAANAWNQALGGIGGDLMQMYFLSQMGRGQWPGGTPPYFPPGTTGGGGIVGPGGVGTYYPGYPGGIPGAR